MAAILSRGRWVEWRWSPTRKITALLWDWLGWCCFLLWKGHKILTLLVCNSTRPSDAHMCKKNSPSLTESPVWHQAIIWTKVGLMLDWTFGNEFHRNLKQITIFIHLKNVFCKKSAFLSWPPCHEGVIYQPVVIKGTIIACVSSSVNTEFV